MDFLLGQNWNESADSARYYDFRLYISDHDKRKSCFQDFVCVSSTSVAANPVLKALLLFVKEASTAELYVFFSWYTTLPPAKECIKTRRMTQNLPTVLLPWKARMFVNHPNAADCVLLHSLRKPRWGEHFTPPLCKSFRKLGRLARCVAASLLPLGWLAGRQIHFEPSGEKKKRKGKGKGKGRKSLKRARKATSRRRPRWGWVRLSGGKFD